MRIESTINYSQRKSLVSPCIKDRRTTFGMSVEKSVDVVTLAGDISNLKSLLPNTQSYTEMVKESFFSMIDDFVHKLELREN